MEVHNPTPLSNDFPQKVARVAATRWRMPGWAFRFNIAQLVQAGRIYACPIFIEEQKAYDRIGINVSVGDGLGGLCDLRIFAYAGGLPAAEILSAGTVSTNAPGAKEIVIAWNPVRGYYFLCARYDQAPTMHAINGDAVQKMPVDAYATSNTPGNFNNCVLETVGAYTDPAGVPSGETNWNLANVRLREA